jgi:regulator of sigma E protease
MIGWYIVGALGLALLMVVHEGGHFYAARAFGMRVTKFSIGFGPTFFKILPKDGFFWFTTAGERVRVKLWKHDPERHGPTVYQVAMIPFLAYVQIAGLNPLEEVDPEDKGSYANASLIARIVTIFAGPVANYLFASLLFFFSFFIGGKPAPPPEPLSTDVIVIEGRPAATAGIKDGDRVVEINGEPVQEWKRMADIISEHPDQPIAVVVQRKEERITLSITPSNVDGKGRIGVATPPTPERKVPVSAKEAAWLAIASPPQVVKNLVIGLGQLVTGKAEAGDLAGPVGIVKETGKAAQRGWTELLFILGAISAYLGAFNLIPFPALDGGRLMFLGYEATTRRRPNARIEAHIHAIGLVMMLGLMIYVTVAKDFGIGGSK